MNTNLGKDYIKATGLVRTVQMDADHNIIPGTEKIGHNAIRTGLLNYLAMAFGPSVFTVTGSDITADADLVEGHLYKVNTSTIQVPSGTVFPVGSMFVYGGETIVWGTGKVKEVPVKAINNLFDDSGEGASVINAHLTEDGIAFGSGDGNDFNGILETTVNQGGAGSNPYIEFYGEFYNDTASSITIGSYLNLGRDIYLDSIYYFRTLFSTYAMSDTVAAGRRFGVYWRITLSI